MWTQAQAISWCQEKWPIAKKLGWYIGLTGSNLYRGNSEKDIDIILYKHRGCDPPAPFYDVLKELCDKDKDIMPAYVLTSGDEREDEYAAEEVADIDLNDGKGVVQIIPMQIWVGYSEGRRIDFFIFGEPKP